MEIFGVDVGERAEVEIPLVGVVGVEVEVGVLLFVGLLHHGVFEIVTLAQRAVAVIVVVHPLVGGEACSLTAFSAGWGWSSGSAAVSPE